MGDATGIQWTDATWNPIRGCSRVSEGCRNCYAEGVARRFSGPGQPYEGLVNAQGRWNGTVRFIEGHLDQPRRWTRPRRIFVNSMSDLFHEALTDEQIDRIFEVMEATPRHNFQVLTKRAKRMARYVAERYGIDSDDRVPGHIWLGVSAEDQAAWSFRVPQLLTFRGVRWVSVEPQTGRIAADADTLSCLDWIVVGGESGPGARPFDPAWAREFVAEGAVARTPIFVKQLGRQPVGLRLSDPKGGDMSEWPEDLRVRQFPCGVRS